MRAEFIAAVVDTLVPGDDGDPPLPRGTVAGIASRVSARWRSELHQGVLNAIAHTAGGEDEFVRADAAMRTAVLHRVDSQMPAHFASMALIALTEYYQSDAVLVALGWPVEPPQPRGHEMAPFDEGLLELVKRRARMWR